MSEAKLMRAIQVLASKVGARLFRNNVALAWVGRPEKITAKKTVTVYPGDVVVRGARPLHAGLCVGSSDLVGWKPVVITEEYVRENGGALKVAVFTAIEVKDGDGKPTDEQAYFIKKLQHDGGLGVVAWSDKDALTILR